MVYFLSRDDYSQLKEMMIKTNLNHRSFLFLLPFIFQKSKSEINSRELDFYFSYCFISIFLINYINFCYIK